MEKMTQAEMLNKLRNTTEGVFDKTLFSIQDVIKIVENIELPTKLPISEQEFLSKVEDVVDGGFISDKFESGWNDDYVSDYYVSINSREIDVTDFELDYYAKDSLESLQSDLMNKITDHLCNVLTFTEKEEVAEEQVEEQVAEVEENETPTSDENESSEN